VSRELSAGTRLAAFGAGLLLILGAAVVAGRLVGPVAPADAGSGPTSHGAGHAAGHGAERGSSHGADHGAPFSFRILGPDGSPVTRYTANHERDLHLIVARRDLSGFQHVHPTVAADGTWSTALAVAAPGQYRVIADFQPVGRTSGTLALGVDLPSAGDCQPVALPPPARTATVDGYTVELAGDLVAGRASTLTAKVGRDGQEVTDLQPYLGALGHLVALRDDDLAYLHVHPGDGVRFHAEVPSAGSYRLYLEFQHAGAVHRAEFTVQSKPAPGE
jgi:hypothetical protein